MSTYSINMRNQICNAVVPRCKCRLTAGHERQIHCIYNPSERLRFGTGSLDGPPPPAAGPGCWAPSLAFATAVAAARSMSSSCPCMRRFRLRFGMSTFGLSRSRVSGLKALRLRSTSRMPTAHMSGRRTPPPGLRRKRGTRAAAARERCGRQGQWRHTSHLGPRNRAHELVRQRKRPQPERLAPLLPLRVAVDLPQPTLRAFNGGRVHLHRFRGSVIACSSAATAEPSSAACSSPDAHASSFSRRSSQREQSIWVRATSSSTAVALVPAARFCSAPTACSAADSGPLRSSATSGTMAPASTTACSLRRQPLGWPAYLRHQRQPWDRGRAARPWRRGPRRAV